MAAISDKAEAFLAWASGWPVLEGYVKMNAIVADEGEASLNGVPNDLIEEAYLDGTALRRYTAQFNVILPWSSGFDSVNADAMRLSASWLDWVAAQYDAGNVPQWDGAEIIGIEPSQNAPSLSFVYQEEGLAEYVFEASVLYIE